MLRAGCERIARRRPDGQGGWASQGSRRRGGRVVVRRDDAQGRTPSHPRAAHSHRGDQMTEMLAPEPGALTGTRGKPRVFIEEWLPAAAIGVECMRERGSASALAPHTYLHVWWARRPLTAARAAVLASLLPADFPRDVFERLLGFWGSSKDLVEADRFLTHARLNGIKVPNPH